MKKYYKCEVNEADGSRRSVLIYTDKIFPKQYNKNKMDQFQELVELAFDEVIANAKEWESIDRDDLEFVYYKSMTQKQLDLEVEFWWGCEEWIEEDDDIVDDEYEYPYDY